MRAALRYFATGKSDLNLLRANVSEVLRHLSNTGPVYSVQYIVPVLQYARCCVPKDPDQSDLRLSPPLGRESSSILHCSPFSLPQTLFVWHFIFAL